MATLHFDDEYGADGSIGMTLAVDDGPMLIPGETFTGAGKTASGTPFTFSGNAGDREGDFGKPEADGWVTEVVSEDHVSGTARYRARPE